MILVQSSYTRKSKHCVKGRGINCQKLCRQNASSLFYNFHLYFPHYKRASRQTEPSAEISASPEDPQTRCQPIRPRRRPTKPQGPYDIRRLFVDHVRSRTIGPPPSTEPPFFTHSMHCLFGCWHMLCWSLMF